MWKFVPLAALLVALCLVTFSLQNRAAAAGPCGTAHDGITAEEAEFAGLLQQWRNATLANSTPLTLSGPLNAAAAWFAQDQATQLGSGGHTDSLGRNWGQRALDCGFPNPYAQGGSGEGVYSVASSQVLNVGPAQAITGITYPGSGVYIQVGAGSGLPVKCFGVAVYRNANGTAVSWVTVIAQFPAGTACPSAVTGTPPSATATPTKTPTKTPTPSPTPSATPPIVHNHPLALSPAGWVFVVLPQGALNSVLARARGCYSAVYQLQGESWLRYSPDIPAYARTLTESNGGVFWISGSAKDCGTIIL